MNLRCLLVAVSLLVGCGDDSQPVPQPEPVERVVTPVEPQPVAKPKPLPETGCLEAVE